MAATATGVMVKPGSAWMVGPSEVKRVATQGTGGVGCSMITQYENGHIVGFHARQPGIVGLTVDTHQNGFVRGRSYQLGMQVGGETYLLNAQATSLSTLSVDLEPMGVETLAKRLSRSGNFNIRFIAGAPAIQYSTAGMNDGIARLQTCLNDELHEAPMLVEPVKLSVMAQPLGARAQPAPKALPSAAPAAVTKTPIKPLSEDALDAPYTDLSSIEDVMPDVSPKGSVKTPPTPILDPPVNLLPPVAQQAQPQPQPAPAPVKVAEPKPAPAPVAPATTAGTPLVFALQKILPPATPYSITGVDPMTPITWQEGSNWQGVLGNALASKNMQLTVDNGRVLITRAGAASQPKPQQVATAPAGVPAVVPAVAPSVVAAAAPVSLLPKTPAPAEQVTKPQQWSARKGNRLVDVLALWCTQAGIQSRLDVPAKLRLSDDVSMQAPFRDAVTALLKQFDGLADARFDGIAPTPVVAPAPAAMASTQTAVKAPEPEKTLWRAAAGEPLRDVLSLWAAPADIDVVWDADRTFELQDNLRYTGSFEDALRRVMAQFEDEDVRPLATLNTDPQTGKKTLVIQTVGG